MKGFMQRRLSPVNNISLDHDVINLHVELTASGPAEPWRNLSDPRHAPPPGVQSQPGGMRTRFTPTSSRDKPSRWRAPRSSGSGSTGEQVRVGSTWTVWFLSREKIKVKHLFVFLYPLFTFEVFSFTVKDKWVTEWKKRMRFIQHFHFIPVCLS